MTAIFNQDDIPSHLLSIPEMSFTQDLLVDRIGGLWFRLGAFTIKPRRNGRGVEDVISRESILLAPERFADIFDKLSFIGNALHNLGKPGGFVCQKGDQKEYSYAPFHRFELGFTSVPSEPLVFVRSNTSAVELFINPDLELFFELKEKTSGCGIWWDPRRGVEALRRRVIEEGNLEIVEIRVDYLRRYLQARQMSLIVGHYRHLHLFDPSSSNVETFVAEDVVLGSPEKGAKAIFQNCGLRQDIPGTPPFLQRRLHLWFEIRPPEIDIDDPWADEPSFDLYTFTLPTRVGPVSPARWRLFRRTEGRRFEGGVCDFMDRVYFRQEVLAKYERASGFDVSDDGSVSHRYYWGLVRSTSRIGNELLATAIGDFAEGVPFEEWSHWKEYAVEPPSRETAAALGGEQTVPDAVNSLVRALRTLNATFARFAGSFGVAIPDPLWQGSLDSLAGRQLKWVYPADADDDEFLKRATLASTLVIDALAPASLRKLLNVVGKDFHLNDGSEGQSLGSRNLLQRVTLVAVLVEDFQPAIAEIPELVRLAESKAPKASKADLQDELVKSHQRVRDEFAPMAFLYDLRTYGGLAHTPNRTKAASAAAQLGLPDKNWHRTDYLRLLNLIARSVMQVSEHLEIAAEELIRGGSPEPE
ncbi:MAG: hypothetical protein Q7T26_00060 [Dehalococcoidia bacterium]|nr:hypothetical protein [Dehalococcoidia bacterium]